MKINIAYPSNGSQKVIVIEDEKKLRVLYDKRMSQEVNGQDLSEEFAGYIFRISGGNDKQGFAMKQGILTNQRVRLLMSKGMSCFRERREGQRKRKSVRGCIVGPDLAVLNLVVVKKGENEIAGLTDVVVPRRLGPKRASNIRKLFNLSKDDDVTKFVVRRTFEKNGKTITKAPKIQRLVTPITLQRVRRRAALRRVKEQKSKDEAAQYSKLLQQRHKEQKEARRSTLSKRRSSARKSSKKE